MRGEAEEVGEDGGGQLGGESGKRCTASCLNGDAEGAEPSGEACWAVIGWPGSSPGNSHWGDGG